MTKTTITVKLLWHEDSCYLFYFVLFYFILFCFVLFLQPHLWHKEAPGLWVKSEHSCWSASQLQQYQIQAASATYTAAWGNARSLTHSVRPGIKPTSSWILVSFVTCWATAGTPWCYILILSTFAQFVLFYFIYFLFLGPNLQHMEAPRLGVELEL